jgi:hypothetical protein
MRKLITIMAAFEIMSATASMAAPPTPAPSTTANPTSANPSSPVAGDMNRVNNKGSMNRVNNNSPGQIGTMNRVNNKNVDQPTSSPGGRTGLNDVPTESKK